MSVTVTAKPLVNTQYAGTSSDIVYTAPSNTKTIIDKFTYNEVSGNTPTLSVWIVPNGQAVGNTYLVKTLTTTANTAGEISELKNHVLNSGDMILVDASAASQISIRCSGREAVTST